MMERLHIRFLACIHLRSHHLRCLMIVLLLLHLMLARWSHHVFRARSHVSVDVFHFAIWSRRHKSISKAKGCMRLIKWEILSSQTLSCIGSGSSGSHHMVSANISKIIVVASTTTQRFAQLIAWLAESDIVLGERVTLLGRDNWLLLLWATQYRVAYVATLSLYSNGLRLAIVLRDQPPSRALLLCVRQGHRLSVILFVGVIVHVATELCSAWCRWIRLLPDHVVMLLVHLMNFSRSHDRRPPCTGLQDVPGTCLVKLKYRKEQIPEVAIVWLLIETQAFDESIGLSELVYYNLINQRKETYSASHARGSQWFQEYS